MGNDSEEACLCLDILRSITSLSSPCPFLLEGHRNFTSISFRIYSTTKYCSNSEGEQTNNLTSPHHLHHHHHHHHNEKTPTSTNMQLLCTPSFSFTRVARSLRKRLLNSKTLIPARAAAASVRNSLHFSSPFHTHSNDKLRHQVRPAALGTVAVLGNGLPAGLAGHAAVRGGEGCSRARKHIDTI